MHFSCDDHAQRLGADLMKAVPRSIVEVLPVALVSTPNLLARRATERRPAPSSRKCKVGLQIRDAPARKHIVELVGEADRREAADRLGIATMHVANDALDPAAVRRLRPAA